jgi:excisionase family DNA binding protein
MENQELLTLQEIATYLKIHQMTVHKLIREENLPVFKVAYDWRARKNDIDIWIEKQKEKK